MEKYASYTENHVFSSSGWLSWVRVMWTCKQNRATESTIKQSAAMRATAVAEWIRDSSTCHVIDRPTPPARSEWSAAQHSSSPNYQASSTIATSSWTAVDCRIHIDTYTGLLLACDAPGMDTLTACIAKHFYLLDTHWVDFRLIIIQCFDAVGWAAGRASGL